MKTMIRFFTALVMVGFVVGALGQQIKVPERLPIGTGFPVDIVIAVDIGSEDGNVSHAEFNYDPNAGSLEKVVVQGLQDLAKTFVPPKGTENQDYWVAANAWRVVETEKGKEYWSIASNFPGYNPERFFKLEDRKIPARNLDVTVAIDLGGIEVYAKGLTEVEVVLVDELGNESSRETSPNGITDKTCSQYPGGSAYVPDALVVDALVAYPPFWETYKKFFGATVDFSPRRGYYILRFGPDKAVWAKYDLETGRKLASNEVLPLRLVLSLVQPTAPSLQQPTGTRNLMMKARITGHVGKSVDLEYREELDAGWKTLKTLTLDNGLTEHTDNPIGSSRFYRARLR